MRDGDYELEDRLFYLCGVGKTLSERRYPELAKRHTNVHLAVKPRAGSVASVGSVYGVTFTITGAQAIPIEPLDGSQFPGMNEKHYRCKNFQFGYQMFQVQPEGILERRDIVTERRSA